jgi:signal transduction histidine kinase
MKLEEHGFLSLFPSAIAAKLIQQAEIVNFPAGHIIFREGDQPDFLYLVLSGTVNIVKGSKEKPQLITQIVQNQYFGEYGVWDGENRSADAVASDNVSACKISRQAFFSAVSEISSTSIFEIVNNLTKNIRATTEKYVENMYHKTKMSALGEMLRSILHDFRNPFAIIKMASGAILDIHNEPEIERFCHIIDEQIIRMNNMTEEILDYSRGNVKINLKLVKLSEVLDYFMFLNQAFLKQSHVELDVQGLDVELMLDMNKFMRVLQNLVNNAAEMFAQRRDGHVRIGAKIVDNGVEIEVADNGPGIPESIREKLFQPFATHSKEKGIGLGLAIAKSLVEAHHGNITVKTETGKGTSFYLWFPLSQ